MNVQTERCRHHTKSCATINVFGSLCLNHPAFLEKNPSQNTSFTLSMSWLEELSENLA